MKLFKYILLCFSITSYLICEEVEITVISDSFTIDTVAPEIELYSPSHGDIFQSGETVIVSWDASDDSPAPSMTLNVSAYLDDPYMELASGFPNTGTLELNVPDFINTLFASVRLDITDHYGNVSSAFSNGYFTLGNPNEGMYDVVNETVNIQNTSEAFEIDTKTPEVVWIFPNQATSFNPLQGQVVRWNATDETLPEDPIDLLFINAGVDSYSLAENVINNGQNFIYLPNIEASLGHFKVIATDSYGNVGYDLSDEYMSIGEDTDTEVQEESVTIEVESEPFEIDTKLPVFSLINDNDYFYPNGGELLTDYNNINFNWNANDDSFENGQVEVSLAYLLGGWYTSLGMFDAQNPYTAGADFSIDGLVENTIWGRLIYTAIDDYGNSNSQYSDDYFTLGSSDGNISADLLNEENIDMFISWTWENQKHNIKFNHRALENLQHGDQIVIVGENSIQNSDCLTPLGSMTLGSTQIQAQGWGGNNSADRIVIDQGVNHCNYGGGALPGYTLGDSIRIQIIGSESSYFLRPSDYRGSLVFNNHMTIIKQFNSTPYNVENFNNDNNSEDYSDYEGFFITCSSSNFEYQDCFGTCFDNSSCTNNTYDGCIIGDFTWLGDGYCDDGTYGLVFTCDEYGNDCGDCELEDDPYGVCSRNSSTNSNSFSDQLKFYNNVLINDSRDWDGFNVYGKVTNHQGSSRSCDNDGICDTSELLDLYTNESDCTENNGIWDVSICYYDYNDDGVYSPEEVDENVADCYSDCCQEQGEGENEDWCFIETVDSEEYTHSLVQSNYLPVNTSSATVNYRVWLLDDQSNEIYKTVDTEDYDVQINTDDIPDYIKNLSSGWNWISLNVENENMSLNNIFANSTFLNEDFIKNQTIPSQYYIPGNQWYPDWDMNLENMYLMNIAEETSILYNGSYPNPLDIPITIEEGWTWIGYVPSTSLDINTALSSINPENGDFIKNQTTPSQYYIPGDQWYPALTMEPTQGYMTNFASSHTLIYPTVDSDTNQNVPLLRLTHEPDFNYRQYKHNASLTIELDMPHLQISNNDIIRAFFNKEQRGMVLADICPLNDKILFNLMIYSNNEIDNDISFLYYNDKTGKKYNIRETVDFEKDAILGNAYNPIILTDIAIPLKYELKNPYPNPFNPISIIEFSLIEDQSNFSLNIYDIRGRLVESLYSGYINYGYHKYKWDASRFSSGIYFVHMITEKNIFTKKITLLK